MESRRSKEGVIETCSLPNSVLPAGAATACMPRKLTETFGAPTWLLAPQST